MGNHSDKGPGCPEVYYLTKRQVRIIREIWKSVEMDLAYYGSQFYTLLFRNHPEFCKYFQENIPHEFQIDVPAMRSKFSLVCSTLTALFVDYSHKSKPRDNLLGYVAMVHKDMNLTHKDMENFIMVMMEMLMEQFPKQLTADCVLAYVRYTGSLVTQIQILMEKQRESTTIDKEDLEVGCFSSVKCGWLPCQNENLIYGRPAEYWNKKSRHWMLQKAVWATASEETSFDSFRKDAISKSSVFNNSLSSKKDETSSSDEDSERYQSPSISRKRTSPKQKNLAIFSLDDETETGAKSTDFEKGDRRLTRPKQNALKTGTEGTNFLKDRSYAWSRSEQPYDGRSRLVVYSTARERRRKSTCGKVTLEELPRLGTLGRHQSCDSSSPESEDKVISSSSQSLNVPTEGMKNRGTSISNVPVNRSVIKRSIPEKRHRRTTFSAKTDPQSCIIGSRTTESKNIKANKRVSISDVHWPSPRGFNE